MWLIPNQIRMQKLEEEFPMKRFIITHKTNLLAQISRLSQEREFDLILSLILYTFMLFFFLQFLYTSNKNTIIRSRDVFE